MNTFLFSPDSSKTLSSYVIGDTSIRGEIGLNSMKDVKSLTAPLELKSESRSSTFQGLDLSWCKAPKVGLPTPDLVLYLDITLEIAANYQKLLSISKDILKEKRTIQK